MRLSISGDQPYVFSEKDSERISNELFKEECQVDTTLTVKVQNNVISFGSNSGNPARIGKSVAGSNRVDL